MTCTQCNQNEQMPNDEICTTCSSDNYFREFSFTEQLEDPKQCNACGQYEDHDQDVTNCPAFSYENGVLFGILTLGQLRNFTKHLPDTTQIVVSDLDRNWLNVNLVSLPDNDETFAITLITTNTFDPRQF